MTASNNNSANLGIDKQALYGDFRDHQKRRGILALKAAYKSLDIADDDMDIRADNSRHGIGALGALGIAAVSGGLPLLGGLGLWAAGAFDKPEIPEKPDPPAVVQPALEPEQPEEKPPIIIKEKGEKRDFRFGDPIVEPPQ